MKKLQPIRGTKDILEEEYGKLLFLSSTWYSITSSYGFNMVETPIMEDSEVFKKTLGLNSDIIKKETYTFKDRSNNEITLRPEGTAPIVRSFINNKLHYPLPQKFSYIGPMFRYDRPQKGRLRQFSQFGAEIIGDKDISADLELIHLAKHFVNDVGIHDRLFKIHVNSLGDEASRKKYVLELKNFFEGHKKSLTVESLDRLEKNPLRILDTKNTEEKKLLVKAPKLKDFLSNESSDIFEEFKKGCEQLEIPIILDDNLVRGLDYYNNICYEFISTNIGAQDTFLAGGRYDGLVKNMGGPDYPGCGFAIGVERVNLIWPTRSIPKPEYYVVIAVGKENKIEAMKIINKIRKKIKPIFQLISIDLICKDNLSKGLRYASEKKAGYAIIIGQEEILNKEITVKDLKKRKQKKIKTQNLDNFILDTIQVKS